MPVSLQMDPFCVDELELIGTVNGAKREEYLRQMAVLLLSSLPEKYAEIYDWIQVATKASQENELI